MASLAAEGRKEEVDDQREHGADRGKGGKYPPRATRKILRLSAGEEFTETGAKTPSSGIPGRIV